MTSSLTSLLQTLRIVPMAHTKLQTAPAEKLTDKPSSNVCSIPIITLQEVAQHDSYDDCWIVVYDRVYAVTDFLHSHPGGEDIIMEHAGRDATLAFHGTGHSRDAIEQMREFLIGELPVAERIFRTGSNGAKGRLIRIEVPE